MNYSTEINSEGFAIINNVYTENEIEKLISLIENITENDSYNAAFRNLRIYLRLDNFIKKYLKP